MCRIGAIALAAGVAVFQSSCRTSASSAAHTQMLVSVKDQRLILVEKGVPRKAYPISTSKFGLGDKPGSHKTPLGHMRVYRKIGGGYRKGTVFKSRRPTGEVVKPNSPGRDPIVTRILWLEGQQRKNRNAKRRYIYVHGTPEERTIGTPSSYGCIRMKSRDIVDLYKRVPTGAGIFVKKSGLRLAEVPQTDKALYAAVMERERPLAPAPAPSSPAPSVVGESTEVLAAAAASSKTRPPSVRNVVAPAKRSESSAKDWRISRKQARSMFLKKL